MELCTFDLLQVALEAAEQEVGAKIIDRNKAAHEARYHFVYFAFTKLGARPKLIQSFIPEYTYSKTVYQVIRRQYLRRKQPEQQAVQSGIQIAFREVLAKYQPKLPEIKHKPGKQLKISFV